MIPACHQLLRQQGVPRRGRPVRVCCPGLLLGPFPSFLLPVTQHTFAEQPDVSGPARGASVTGTAPPGEQHAATVEPGAGREVSPNSQTP